MVKENLVSYFPSLAYDSIVDLAETIMNPVNCRSSIKDNINFAHPEPIYVYTDIIKRNFVGDPYVRLLTPCTSHRLRFTIDLTIHCTSQWNNPIYSISIRLFMKTGENVLFKENYMPGVVILPFNKRSLEK